MDLIAHSVVRAGRRIDLTGKEYALLEFFLRNQERVVSRSQLAEHVWDQYFDPLSKVIDVSVSHLRKKMELAGGPKLLHSVRGMGYILKATRPEVDLT
jgi:two-component system copper resistance phosphate regulon response regulator CusR